ncbi:(Fe-S)-binding protein [bacterium]|nr:(Fe-S)-binding protein [candidate division CSSED10-310 bacterium]
MSYKPVKMKKRNPDPGPGRSGDSPSLTGAEDVVARAIQGLGIMHATACMHCGFCADTCHIYLAEPKLENIPAQKFSEITRYIRRRHTLSGRLFSRFVKNGELTQDVLRKISDAVYGRCTACGRCTLQCPVGIDLREIIRIGRKMCAAVRQVPEGLQRTVDNQIQTGNQMAIPREEILSTLDWLAEDLKMEMKDPSIEIPIDQPGKDFLYLINPREIKFFPLSLLSAAGVFHAAGASWTLSSRWFDVTNYGFYAGDTPAATELTRRVIEEAVSLNVKEIILSECGHGYRSFRWEGPHWIGQEYPVSIRSVIELLDEFIRAGRIRVDPTMNPERTTLHDPCNLVRLGGIVDPQRRILRRTVGDFVEMTPNRENNFCCGGGGGMLSMSEFGDVRVASGKIKADQIRATGAKIVATPCHNCADQLIELSKKYKLGVEIQAVVELVYNALIR